jgi:chromosome segregation ATPase
MNSEAGVAMSESDAPTVLDRVKAFLGVGKSDSQQESPDYPDQSQESPTEGDDDEARESSGGAIERLSALLEERDRVQGLVIDEEKRAEALKEQLRQKEEQRIDALTNARLAGEEADASLPEQLAAELATLRSSIVEAEAVAKRLRAQVDRLDRQIAPLKDEYRQEMSVYLDALYREAIDRYRVLAPDLANAVLRVAAIRRLMIRRGLGNSNGWSGDILLPSMKWQEGNTLYPMLDGGSRDFADAAEDRVSQLEEELRQFGFKYNWK